MEKNANNQLAENFMINTQMESTRGKSAKVSQSGDGMGSRGMKPATSSAREGGSTTEGKSRAKKSSTGTAMSTSGGDGAGTKQPSHDEIAALAHQIYVKKGCPADRDLENWLEAEEQLRAR